MPNAVTKLTHDEVARKVLFTDIDLAATDLVKEIVPAVAGFIPVIVSEDLNFTGTYTVEYQDGEGDASFGGEQTYKADGHRFVGLLEAPIIGSAGKIIRGVFTKTTGNCKGRIGYVYMADGKAY